MIWRGDRILDGVPDAMAGVRALGRPVLFLTNNASYVPGAVAERLQAAGIDAEPEEVLTSAIVAREWVQRAGLEGGTAYVLAVKTVVEQLRGALQPVSLEEDHLPDVVVVGRDLEFDFRRLHLASAAVRAGARFLAFNRDLTMPLEHGIEPGTGAIVAAIEAASGVPPVVLGKPEPPMMDAAKRRLPYERVLMIGDRADSDVAGARTAGWVAALVATGVTASIDEAEPRPDHFLRNLGEIHAEVRAQSE